jgi:prepilin-type N-terminal cleavage/methylation domain-containing protein/prepilin-type processing-associated H-X9-DG protein
MAGHKKTGGFTLIELLVVIAVIALLLSIMAPALSKVHKQAKAVVCLHNLHEWGLVWRMYTDDNDGYFHSGDIGDWSTLWMAVLWRYYCNSREICFCPMAMEPSAEATPSGNIMGGTFTAWGIFTGNFNWHEDDLYGSYGINGWTRNPPEEIEAQYHGHFPTAYNWRQPDARGGGNIPLFLDSRWPDGWMDHNQEPPAYEAQATFARFCINRHDGGVNGVFLDFSVRKIGLKELWTLKWHREFDTDGPWTVAGGAQPEDWPRWMSKFRDY